MRTIKTIAIIGAGNGGCAAAAHLTQRGFDIRLYGRSAGTTEPLRAIGGVEYEGVLGEGFAPLSLITNDAAAAIAGADLVLIMAPTHAHEDVARTIAPHIAREQLVMAAPGHTLLLIPNAIRAAGGKLGTYCDSSSLPFICRKSAPDRIRITRVAQVLYFAVFPGAEVDAVAEMVRHVFPQIHPTPSLLHTVFPYTNAIHHPPALLLNVGRVESTGGDYHHYYDGITPAVGRLIDALDAERVAVAAALDVAIELLPQFFFPHGIHQCRRTGRRHRLRRLSQQRAQPLDQGAGQHRSSLYQRGRALWAGGDRGARSCRRRANAVRGRSHRHCLDRRRAAVSQRGPDTRTHGHC